MKSTCRWEISSAGGGGLPDPRFGDEEPLPLVDLLGGDPFELRSERPGHRTSQVGGECEGADRGAVEDLEGGGPARLLLPPPLQGDDLVDEGHPRPRLVLAPDLSPCDDLRRRLLHHGMTEFAQAAQDGGLARAGCAGENVAMHGGGAFRGGVAGWGAERAGRRYGPRSPR